MLHQLIIGTALITATLLIHAGFIATSITVIRRYRLFVINPPYMLKTTLILSGVALWLMAAHTLEIWLWAACFLVLDVFQTIEPAVYFALVCLTTLGFGDITLSQDWRILSGLGGANGMILFGLSTAYLIELLLQLRQVRTRRNAHL